MVSSSGTQSKGKVLVVTGLGTEFRSGSSESGKSIAERYRAEGYEVEVQSYPEYKYGSGRNYDYVVGHSMGGIKIQTDPSLDPTRIVTFNSIRMLEGAFHVTATNDWLHNLMPVQPAQTDQTIQGGHTIKGGS